MEFDSLGKVHLELPTNNYYNKEKLKYVIGKISTRGLLIFQLGVNERYDRKHF